MDIYKLTFVSKYILENKFQDMKYVKTYESFKTQKNEPVNEEFLGAIFNLIKGVYNKAKAAVNKTKGGKEVQAIYDKYLKIINDQLAKKAQVELNLKSEEETLKAEKKPAKTTESFLIKEADEAPVVDETEAGGEKKDNKLDAATLKKKMNVILQIINLQKDAAKKEMQNILKKFGGAEKNPDLATLIDNKVREFDLALLTAEIDYLEKAGDKEAVKKLAVNRDKITKELDAKYKKIGTGASADIKVGDKTIKLGVAYRYKTENGIKTIKVKGESEEEGKVQAAFTYGDSKDKVQNFSADNIELDFKPEKGKKYKYFSENNQKEIDVEVTGEPTDKGMVPVKTGKAEFNVEVGQLLDVVEKKG